ALGAAVHEVELSANDLQHVAVGIEREHLVGAATRVVEHEPPLSLGLNDLWSWHENLSTLRGDAAVLIVGDHGLGAAARGLAGREDVRVLDPVHVGWGCRALQATGRLVLRDLERAALAVGLRARRVVAPTGFDAELRWRRVGIRREVLSGSLLARV